MTPESELYNKWNTETSGRWTAKILPGITHWMERKFVEVNYYLLQLLSAHDYFYKYLSKMGKITRLNCIYGDESIDDVQYPFFHCERWRLERRNPEAKVSACIIENFCDVILSSRKNWDRMLKF